MTQKYHLASMAVQLFSTGISHHKLTPHIPSICLSAVNSSACPEIAPQFLSSTSQPLPLFQETRVPIRVMYGCCKDCLILIPFRLPRISCFILSLTCFSSDSDNCPDVGINPCFSFPPAEGRSSPTNAPVFPASSFVLVLRGSINSFPRIHQEYTFRHRTA